MADGNSDDPDEVPYNRQTFPKAAGDPETEWFGNNKGPFGEIKVSTSCGCTKLTGDEQDATRYALRLHGAQSKWRFRCNDQPGFALCQKPGPAE